MPLREKFKMLFPDFSVQKKNQLLLIIQKNEIRNFLFFAADFYCLFLF